MATEPGFAAPVVELSGIPTTTVTLADPLVGASCYYWRVQGTNSCDTGLWSDTFHFATVALGVMFQDDIESGGGNWSHAATQGTDHWAISTVQSHSPTHSWFVPDDSTLTDSRLWNTAAVAVGAGLAYGAVGLEVDDGERRGLMDVVDVSEPAQPVVLGALDAALEDWSALAP